MLQDEDFIDVALCSSDDSIVASGDTGAGNVVAGLRGKKLGLTSLGLKGRMRGLKFRRLRFQLR